MGKIKDDSYSQKRKFSVGAIPGVMSNTAYVNTKYPIRDLTKMIFPSSQDAYDWITRFGNPSENNRWRILGDPNEDKSFMTNPYIGIWDSSEQYKIPLSNTVWINQDLSDDETNRIFTTYANAVAWIIANGNPTASNQWQIILCGGTIGKVTIEENIKISGGEGTVIDELDSNVKFTSFTSIFNSYISNVQINNLAVKSTYCAYIHNSVINDAEASDGTTYLIIKDSTILKGDYSNYTLRLFNCDISPIYGNIINLSYFGYQCTLNEVTNTITLCNSINHMQGQFNITSYINDCKIELSNVISNNVCKITGSTKLTVNNSKLKGLAVADHNVIVIKNTYVETITGDKDNITVEGSYYDNRTSGLTAEDTQGAIDELKTLITTPTYHTIALIDFKDLNALGDATTLKLVITDAKPVRKLFVRGFAKLRNEFTNTYGYAQNTIINVAVTESIKTLNLLPAGQDKIPSDKKADINVCITLSSANAQDWITGLMEIVIEVIDYPTI